MKRLLVFFFVFFSLGLTLNVNANSNDKIFCIIKTSNSDNFVFIPIDESEIYKLENSKYNWKSILKNTSIKHPLTTQEKKELKFCNLKVYKSKNYTTYFDLKKQWEALGGFSGSSLIHHKPLASYLGGYLNSELYININKQITKIEPSQTYDVHTWFTYNRWYKSNKRMTEYANEVHHKLNHKGYCSTRNKVTKCKTIYFATIDREMRKKFPSYNFRKSKFIEILQEQKTQIAKAEPAKKKKIVKKEQPKKKKKKVKKEITNISNSQKIKKIIKIDNKEPIKENISLWEKNVLAALEREKNDPYCEIVDKKTFKILFKKKKSEKIVLNFCIKKSDLLKLGEYKKFNPPTFILDDLKGCKSSACVDKKAGKKVYELFVRRGSQYHARHPGDMIKGMVWFEILYQAKLKKAQKVLKMYQENNYKDFMALKKKDHEKQIYSLIKLNKGRLKMRKALGFSLYNDLYEVIEGQWLLAEFLNKDKLKVSKVKLTPEMFKRKILIEKYKTVLAKYQKKLEEEKQKKIK